MTDTKSFNTSSSTASMDSADAPSVSEFVTRFASTRLPLSNLTAVTTRPNDFQFPSAALARLSALRGQYVLVTGGAGFLGSHIVDLLVLCGARVRVFDIARPPPAQQRADVEYVQGDLLSRESLSAQLVSSSGSPLFAIFHVASPSPTSRDGALFQRVNVGGTANVIDCARRAGVKRLIFTSSASVIFGGDDQLNGDETLQPPLAALDAYTKSKLAAEQLVLAADTGSATAAGSAGGEPADMLLTCAIRPHGIFGPRDPHMLPRMGKIGLTGKSKYQIGNTLRAAHTHCRATRLRHLADRRTL
jgi:sterol-4alpha-carboxylate 3-dehydrogenase (decarboxylating)